MQTYSITTLGSNHRNTPRIWLQGGRLDMAGFAPARRYSIDINREEKRLTLRLATNGEKGVCGKEKGGKVAPVIDICNAGLLSIFAGVDKLRVIYEDGAVHISPLASEARKIERAATLRAKLENNEPLSVGSVSTGVGALSLAIHQGLKRSGIDSRLAFACDIEPLYIEQCAATNPVWSKNTVMLAAPLQELAFDPWAVRRLPQIDLLEAGIPCTAHSPSGRSKKNLVKPEDDQNAGHLVAGLLALVAALNPAALVLECVPSYINSSSFAILKTQLTEWGYDVRAEVLKGEDFNVLEHRERMALVAVTEGIPFDFLDVLRPAPVERHLAEILEPVPDDSPMYSKMEGLKAKQLRDIEAGKGYRMQIFTGESTHVCTLTRGYAKVRSTDAKIQHPTNPELLRLMTPTEHARAKEIPAALIAGLSATRAHEVLGQAVLMRPFIELAATLGRALRQWANALQQRDAAEHFQLQAA